MADIPDIFGVWYSLAQRFANSFFVFFFFRRQTSVLSSIISLIIAYPAAIYNQRSPLQLKSQLEHLLQPNHLAAMSLIMLRRATD